MEPGIPIPKRLRKRRELSGLKQVAVARRAGIPQQTYCGFENGWLRIRRSRVERVRKIIEAEIARRALELAAAMTNEK
jgi:predicted transcriptional regulator